MAQRGRKSATKLSVIRGKSNVPNVGIGKPKPPPSLTKEQKREWEKVVGSLPDNWFPEETHAMLEHYCKRVCTMRKISGIIDELESAQPLDLQQYEHMLKLQERESKTVAAYATRMRLTQQSSIDPERKKSKPTPSWDR